LVLVLVGEQDRDDLPRPLHRAGPIVDVFRRHLAAGDGKTAESEQRGYDRSSHSSSSGVHPYDGARASMPTPEPFEAAPDSRGSLPPIKIGNRVTARNRSAFPVHPRPGGARKLDAEPWSRPSSAVGRTSTWAHLRLHPRTKSPASSADGTRSWEFFAPRRRCSPRSRSGRTTRGAGRTGSVRSAPRWQASSRAPSAWR